MVSAENMSFNKLCLFLFLTRFMGLSNILYTTLRASDEIYEVRALAGDVDLAGIVHGRSVAKESATDV